MTITSNRLKLSSSLQTVCKDSKTRWLLSFLAEALHAKEQGKSEARAHMLLKCSVLVWYLHITLGACSPYVRNHSEPRER